METNCLVKQLSNKHLGLNQHTRIKRDIQQCPFIVIKNVFLPMTQHVPDLQGLLSYLQANCSHLIMMWFRLSPVPDCDKQVATCVAIFAFPLPAQLCYEERAQAQLAWTGTKWTFSEVFSFIAEWQRNTGKTFVPLFCDATELVEQSGRTPPAGTKA